MASVEVKINFIEQVKESRRKIRDCFKKSHEALQLRESILLSRIDEIEKDYNTKTQEMQELLEALDKSKSFITDTLTSNKLKATHRGIESLLNKQIEELSADTDSSIAFEWNNQFETDIEQLGSIKLNGQTNKPPTRTFPPQVKPVIPNYKAKQLPTAYCCNNSNKKALGELNCPRGIAVHYQTGNIYLADCNNHRIQVFSSNGDYLFMFSEKMNNPVGICITHNKVFVTQYNSHYINKYELEGKLIKSVGRKGNGEAQFYYPCGLDVFDGSARL
ncbi:NHL repeat containing protein [Oopsacas minuta]|uniref:NHL repeat containing protein n=1 Tax=Oopsacas minuta TaxID=111878 RepID=A0AAV7KBN3_9METZ|nr:NHL repeat containing protein [Oopsacas minuta]